MFCQINNHTLTSACGVGNAALNQSIDAFTSSLIRNNYASSYVDTWIGRVNAADDHSLTPALAEFNTRNNRLADLALDQDGLADAVQHVRNVFGAHRIGVLIGTSTSSIGKTEEGYTRLDENSRMPPEYRRPLVHNPHAPGHYVATRLDITGPAMTISTACSSSSKVFAAAERWLRADIVDAVVVGGVDSLCLSILHGFASLELTSPEPCRPFDIDRNGISIGEAAGFALVTRSGDHDRHQLNGAIRLNGCGESSDAHHMAQPHPEGDGARRSMLAAIAASTATAEDLDYVNLHGTASRANDLAETVALSNVFANAVPVSSTKAWTGHTLGAAGIAGAVIAIEALRVGRIPGTLHLDTPDPDLAFPIQASNLTRDVSHVMTNSFGFGGNNCSLVFSREEVAA